MQLNTSLSSHTLLLVIEMIKFFCFLFFQYHRQQVMSRDNLVKDLAKKHGIPGYNQQKDFSASSIWSFISKLSQIRQCMEEEATQRKVGIPLHHMRDVYS